MLAVEDEIYRDTMPRCNYGSYPELLDLVNSGDLTDYVRVKILDLVLLHFSGGDSNLAAIFTYLGIPN